MKDVLGVVILLYFSLISTSGLLNSGNINSTIKYDLLEYTSTSKITFFSSAITKSGKIVFGGTSCSFLSKNCLTIMQIFNKNFEIELQKLHNCLTKNEIGKGII